VGEGGRIDDYFTKSGRSSVSDFLDSFFLHNWGPNGARMLADQVQSKQPTAVGFKLKYQQLDKYPEILPYLREHKIKIIHLIRRNLLASIISAEMVPEMLARFRHANLSKSTRLDGLSLSVSLDSSTIVAQLSALEYLIDKSKAVIAGLPTIEVTYEDLIQSPTKTNRSILRFLGIDPRGTLKSKYRKIMPNLPKDGIRNIGQIREILGQTRFARYLDE